MNLRINFFAKSVDPGAEPIRIAHADGDFSSLEEAQKIAFADADKPTLKAELVTIESSDETVRERWVRNGSQWQREAEEK